MKKFLITLMILSVALTSVFAIDGLKVGGEVGYTRYGVVLRADEFKTTVGVNTFTFAGVAEYQVLDGVDVVAKLGLDVHGKPHSKVTIGDVTIEETGDTVPVHFAAYVGGKYTYTINDKLSASAGLGLDFMVGKLDKDSEKAGVFLGLKAELGGKYKVTDKLAVTLGGGFTWIFVDTTEENKELKKEVKDAGGYYFENRFGFTAGVTYSL